MTTSRTIFLGLALQACAVVGDAVDGGGGGGRDTGTNSSDPLTGSDTDTNAGVDGCEWLSNGTWVANICFEFVDFDQTIEYCDELRGAYGGSDVDYVDGPCPDGAVYACDLSGVGSGVAEHEPTTAYYYDDQGDNESDCLGAGGTGHSL